MIRRAIRIHLIRRWLTAGLWLSFAALAAATIAYLLGQSNFLLLTPAYQV